MNRSCQQDSSEKWSFLCYSKTCDGVVCRVLFPDSSHRLAKYIRMAKHVIPEPYQDWKDLPVDIRNHAFTDYHLNSMARLKEFIRTMNNPEKGVGVTISGKK